MARVRAHRSSQAGWVADWHLQPYYQSIQSSFFPCAITETGACPSFLSLLHHHQQQQQWPQLSKEKLFHQSCLSNLPGLTWLVLIIIICCCWRWWGLTCKGRKVSEEYEYMWDGWGWLATRVLLCGYHGSDQVSGVAREGVLLYYYISIIMNDDDVVGSFVRRMSAEEEVVLDMWAIIKLLTGHGSSPR